MYTEPATKNQIQFIRVLEEKVGIQFTGRSKKEAAWFINKNYKILEEKRRRARANYN